MKVISSFWYYVKDKVWNRQPQDPNSVEPVKSQKVESSNRKGWKSEADIEKQEDKEGDLE